MYNKCIHAVTENSPSSARQRSAGWGRVDAWRRCGWWRVGSKHGEDAICWGEVGLRAHTGKTAGFVTLLCCQLSLRGKCWRTQRLTQTSRADRGASPRRTSKKLPSRVKARLDGFILGSVMHQQHTPTPPGSISVTLHISSCFFAFISPQFDFESIFFKMWCCSWSTDSSNFERLKPEHFIQEQIAPMHQRARAVVLFYILLHSICDPLAAEWTVLLTLKDYRWKKKNLNMCIFTGAA